MAKKKKNNQVLSPSEVNDMLKPTKEENKTDGLSEEELKALVSSLEEDEDWKEAIENQRNKANEDDKDKEEIVDPRPSLKELVLNMIMTINPELKDKFINIKEADFLNTLKSKSMAKELLPHLKKHIQETYKELPKSSDSSIIMEEIEYKRFAVSNSSPDNENINVFDEFEKMLG